MDVTCPHCDKTFSVPEDEHYTNVRCRHCGKEVQALSDETVELSREFLAQILGEKPSD